VIYIYTCCFTASGKYTIVIGRSQQTSRFIYRCFIGGITIRLGVHNDPTGRATIPSSSSF